MKRVLISNGGGTIAQSIARVLRQTVFDEGIELIALAPALDYVPTDSYDEVVRQPVSYNENDGVDLSWAIESMSGLTLDLAIPTTDFEAEGWAKIADLIPVLVASEEATSIFIDKWKTFQHFREHKLPFAESLLPSNYDNSYRDYIVKPRRGGLSIGLLRNPSFVEYLPDDDYVVQSFLQPSEYTIAFYVSQKGELIGPLVLERQLRYGLTIVCKTNSDHIDEAKNLCVKLCDSVKIVGPCNIQCRYHLGVLVPFEVNCRFSGTCGLRSDMGFSDIKIAIDEFVFGKKPRDPGLISGKGMRRISDELLGIDESIRF